MNIISVYDKESGCKVYEYSSNEVIEWSDYPLTSFRHEVAPEILLEEAMVDIWLTKQEFLDKLGDAAVSFILLMAKTEIEIEKWVKRLDLTTPNPDGTSVNLSDPRTIAGITALGNIMIANNVVTSGWITEVLS